MNTGLVAFVPYRRAPLDASGGPREPDDGRGHRIRLGVRNHDPLPEPGGALLLPTQGGGDQLVHVRHLAGPGEQLRHLPDGCLLAPGIEGDLHGLPGEVTGADLTIRLRRAVDVCFGCGGAVGLGGDTGLGTAFGFGVNFGTGTGIGTGTGTGTGIGLPGV
jgi:hypothetical protein